MSWDNAKQNPYQTGSLPIDAIDQQVSSPVRQPPFFKHNAVVYCFSACCQVDHPRLQEIQCCFFLIEACCIIQSGKCGDARNVRLTVCGLLFMFSKSSPIVEDCNCVYCQLFELILHLGRAMTNAQVAGVSGEK